MLLCLTLLSATVSILICQLNTDLLASIGLPAGSFFIFNTSGPIYSEDIVLAEAAGRRFFGFYRPIGSDVADFILPDRAIRAANFTILGRVVPLEEYKLQPRYLSLS